MMRKKVVLFAIVSFLLSKSVFAQEIDSTLAASGNVHILRLQKSYTLGEGLMVRSSVGNITFNQSLQTLYMVTSANNFNTTSSEFSINRARLTMKGNIFDKRISISTRINFPGTYQSTTTGTRSFNPELEEALIQYSPNPTHTFNVGLRADYIDSRELRIEGEDFGFVGRSAVSSAFDAVFDYGIRYVGNYKLGGRNILKPYLSLTTGDGRAGLQKNYGGLKYGIRVDYLPFDEFKGGGEARMEDLEREQTPKLAVGVVYSIDKGATSAYGTNGGRYLYGDANQNIVLPDYQKYIFDYIFKYRGFYSMGSLIATKATVPSNIAGAFSLTGKFTPYTGQTTQQIQNTVLSYLDVGTGYNIQAGYLFKCDWGIGARYSYLSDNVHSAAFANNNRNYSFIATKYLSGNSLKIQAEIDYSELKNNLQSTNNTGTYTGQIMFCVNL